MALAAALPYVHVGAFDFISLADPGTVRDNVLVNGGLRLQAVGAAITHTASGQWQPLTWLSHMLDCELFGLDPGGHHLMNVALHGLNAVLLLLALRALTGSLWRSALVAAVFAVHPLQVKSVAWISERGEVLSGTFCMLTVLAYAAYARAPSRARFLRVLGVFALGLLAGPLLITLPALLLFLDVWPLRRQGTHGWSALLREKAWMLLLAVGAAAVTFQAQPTGGSGGASGLTDLGPLAFDASRAATATIAKTLWPVDLAFSSPHPARTGRLSEHAGLLSLGVLLTITLLAHGLRTRRPWMWTGWWWFLLTLLPVVVIRGPVGLPMADRATYLPVIGLALMVAWELGERVRTRALPRPLAVGACVAALTAYALAAHAQADTWRSSETLSRHALEVTVDNDRAHALLGAHYLDMGTGPGTGPGTGLGTGPGTGLSTGPGTGLSTGTRDDALALAEEHLRAALALRPDNPSAARDLESVRRVVASRREAAESDGAH